MTLIYTEFLRYLPRPTALEFYLITHSFILRISMIRDAETFYEYINLFTSFLFHCLFWVFRPILFYIVFPPLLSITRSLNVDTKLDIAVLAYNIRYIYMVPLLKVYSRALTCIILIFILY